MVMHSSGIRRLWSGRTRILTLLLVVTMAAFGAIIRYYLLERRHQIEVAKHSLLLLVRSLAAQQGEIESTTKEMLRRLAQAPEVQTLDKEGCSVLLRKLSCRHPYYSVWGVIMPDGTLFASSAHFEPGGVNLLDQIHVKDAIGSQDFSAGEYSIDRVTGVQTIHYSYPSLDSQKHLIAVVNAGFKLDMYAHFIAKANMPINSVVVITDRRGVRLYRSPEDESAKLGQPVPLETFQHMSADPDEGVFEGVAGDGALRINAFSRLSLRNGLPPYLYLMVAIVKDKLLRETNFMFYSSFLIVGLTAFAAAALVWIFPSPNKAG